MNPKHRYNTEQTLNHEWISSYALKSTVSSLLSGFAEHLRSFRDQHKLKKVTLQIVANRLIDTQIKTEEESMTAYKTFITDIHASIEEKQKEVVKTTMPITTSLWQMRISSKELRRQALTALLGVRATGVGRDACLSLSKMAARQEETWRPLPREGVA